MSAQMAAGFLHLVAQGGKGFEEERFDWVALAGMRDIQAAPGSCSCVLPVTPRVANHYGTLHGGAIATLVDVVGSAALMTVSPKGGVSLNINVNYLSKLPVRGEALIEAQVVKAGRSVATIEVQLKDRASGQVVATGTHVKFISPSDPDMLQLIPEDCPQKAQQHNGDACAPAAGSGVGSGSGGTAAAAAAAGAGGAAQLLNKSRSML